LLVDGRDLAPLAVLTTRRERGRGLLGLDGVDGAVLLRPCRSVHTLGMRFAIDVAFCDAGMVVVRTVTLPPGRPGAWTRRGRSVLEADAGAFEHWGLQAGSVLAIGAVP
jgi:uncharacterized membrane protein (UPF0127 family)